jgi:ribonuclease HII
MHEFDKAFQTSDTMFIGGVDEAGRGPLAGPVACACVIMPLDEDDIIANVNDSKKLSAKMREQLYTQIIEKAVDYSVVFVSESEIDEINILNATKLGMKRAINNLNVKPDLVLIDAVVLNTDFKTVSIIKGDAKSYNIACASILAKVQRDRLMVELAKSYPNYAFEKHKGYGTKLHYQALREFGISPVHRKSFLTKLNKTK